MPRVPASAKISVTLKSFVTTSAAFLMSVPAIAAQPPSAGSAPVTIVGPLPVPVTGTTSISGPVSISGTVGVRDVDNPARSPFQATMCTSTSSGGAVGTSCGNLPFSIAVPGDRRVVIEFVAAECSIGGDINLVQLGFSTVVNGTGATYRVHLERNVLDSRFLETMLQTRVYADPGTNVGLATGVGAGPGAASARCTLTLSGYSVALN